MRADRLLGRGIVLAGLLACAALSLALGMDASWDMRNYHYFNGYALVEGRLGFHVLAAQRPTFFNPALDIPLYLAIEHLPAKAVGALLGLLHGINFVLLFALSRILLPLPHPTWRTLLAGLLAALGMAGGMGLGVLGTSFHDNVTSLGFLGGLLIVVRAAADPAGLALRHAFLAGLPAGLAAGFKQPSAVFAVGLCLAFLLAGGSLARRFQLAFLFGLGTLLGIAVAAGPWMLYLWDSYGNPVMPFFNEIFGSPMAELKDYRDTQFLPGGFWPALLFPLRFLLDPSLTTEVPFRDIRILAALLVVPLALASRLLPAGDGNGNGNGAGRLPYGVRYTLLSCALAYLAWLALFGIYRYVVALEMIAPLLVALALGASRLPRRAALAAGAAVLLAMAVTVQVADWDRRPWTERYIATTVPELPDPARTLVLMTGYEATSYVIPAFPEGVRFVRIMSNFTHPFETANRFNGRMRDLVDRHDGPLYSLFVQWEGWHNNQGLEAYGLRWDEARCQPLSGTIMVAPIVLCPVTR